MKILCTAFGKPAVIVGYAPGRKGRPLAIVVCEGKLKALRLKDVVLGKHETELPETVEPLRKRSA